MRVVVAMSGGVDSSVAAALMKEAGHEVIGMALRLWDYSGRDENNFGTCCSPDDLYDARRVAQLLDIPFYVVNSERDFRQQVVESFTESYLKGETPNPCVHCNDTVKFERLLQLARGLGAERLATGHYARKHLLPNGKEVLRKAADAGKDQTYFLFRLDQARLNEVLFPLGDFTKSEVRAMAESRGLPTASKHDSQELCFIPDNGYGQFIEEQGHKAEPGDIVDLDGRVMGRHRGLFHYTIGQRRGLGIANPEPLYVLGVDVKQNRLLVGPDHALFRTGLLAREVNWVAGPPDASMELSARIRYRSKEVPVKWRRREDGRYELYFATPQRAVTPGQAVVFYHDDCVLGGGWIDGPIDAPQTEAPVYAV